MGIYHKKWDIAGYLMGYIYIYMESGYNMEIIWVCLKMGYTPNEITI